MVCPCGVLYNKREKNAIRAERGLEGNGKENIEIVIVYDGSGRSAHLAGQYRRTDGRRGIDYFCHFIIGVFCERGKPEENVSCGK